MLGYGESERDKHADIDRLSVLHPRFELPLADRIDRRLIEFSVRRRPDPDLFDPALAVTDKKKCNGTADSSLFHLIGKDRGHPIDGLGDSIDLAELKDHFQLFHGVHLEVHGEIAPRSGITHPRVQGQFELRQGQLGQFLPQFGFFRLVFLLRRRRFLPTFG